MLCNIHVRKIQLMPPVRVDVAVECNAALAHTWQAARAAPRRMLTECMRYARHRVEAMGLHVSLPGGPEIGLGSIAHVAVAVAPVTLAGANSERQACPLCEYLSQVIGTGLC